MRILFWTTFTLALGLLLASVAEAGQPSRLKVMRSTPTARSSFRTVANQPALADEAGEDAADDETTPSDLPGDPFQDPAEPEQPATGEAGSPETYYEEDDPAPAPTDQTTPDQTLPNSAAGEAAPAPANGGGHNGCCSSSCCDSCCGDDSCCSSCYGCCCEEEEEEPWALFDCCCLEEKGITIAGWVDMGYTYNGADPVNPRAGNGNLPQTFNYRSNEFQFNQLYLYMEKATETSCCDQLDFGGRVDLLYGSDYIFTESLGLEKDVDGSQKLNSDNGNGILGDGTLGLAIPQVYAEVAWKDVKVKLGHFYTPVGYETVTAVDNFFYSHAITHQYGEPFMHTGALTNWAVNDQWTMAAGVTRGWDNWEDDNDQWAFLGGFGWKSCDEKTSWAYYIHTGPENVIGRPAGEDNRFYHSFVFKRKLGCKWNYVFEHDLGIQDNGEAVGGGGFRDAEWYSVTNYLYYDINDCWTAGVRYEWLNDDDGVRANGLLVAPLAYAGHYQNVSVGANWKPNGNLVVRPELRWDWFDSHGTGVPAGPFDNQTDRSQFTAAVDAILKF